MIILPETNGLPLKINGWKMNFLLGRPIFRGELLVSGSVIHDIFKPVLGGIDLEVRTNSFQTISD